jgi:prepilin-type N-terminal cleavage/methylation domain-containing protein
MSRMARVTRLPNGYSLIELMMVVAITGVVSAIAFIQIDNVRPAMKGDGAMRTVVAQMNTARELSISQPRNIQLAFVGSVITLTRQNIAVGAAAPTTTVLASIPLEGGVQFGLPGGAVDTPDGFVNGTPGAPVTGTAMAPGIYVGAATSVFFTSDGSLISLAGLPVNATVFLTVPTETLGTRAVTVFGSVGRIRSYKWNSNQWVRG